jgi:two-component system, LytTR family, sensor histidine kinase LytS
LFFSFLIFLWYKIVGKVFGWQITGTKTLFFYTKKAMWHKNSPYLCTMKLEFNIEDFIQRRWAWHTAFMLLFFGVAYIGYSHNPNFSYYDELKGIVVELLLNISAVYISAWLLLPYLLYKKRFIIYTFAVIILTSAYSYFDFNFAARYYFTVEEIEKAHLSPTSFSGFYIFLLIFGSSLKFAKDTILKEYAAQQTDRLRLLQEANFLRSQLSAHFLLNSMNNLYGLSVVKDERLPSLMLQLSELLQYSLYDTREPYVPLRGELEYLKNYIDLMKIRLSSKVELKVEICEILEENLVIAPMILATYVENAFKHVLENTDKQRFIYIKINIYEKILFLQVRNSYQENAIQNIENINNRKGVGLVNTKRRLELLYPEKHVLSTLNHNGVYEVFLEMETSSTD